MSEDSWLSLNEEFYATKPSTYFRDRLKLLAVRAATPEAVAGEVTWGQLRFVPDPEGDEPDAIASAKAAHARFVATESQVLLHHTAEALLRMFLAHENNPECPWLRMTALKGPGEFGASVRELAEAHWQPDRVNAVGWVFLGSIPDDPPAEWIERRDAAVRLLRLLAQRFNDDGDMYNAAKHGLTATGGTGSFHIITGNDGGLPDPSAITVDHLRKAVVGANGVNIAYLECEGKLKTGRDWFHKTQWLVPEEAAWLTQMAIFQMDALWIVARCHYLGETPPSHLPFINPAAFDALRSFTSGGGSVRSFRRYVATESEE